MTKFSKVVLTLVMACVMLVAGATSALAYFDSEPLAAWNNDEGGKLIQ